MATNNCWGISVVRFILFMLCSLIVPFADAAWLQTSSLRGDVPVQSWQVLRNAKVVKQDSDYSCGAASLATILQFQYGQAVGEEAILKAFDKSNAASFSDMARVLPQFGFKGVGVALDYAQLAKLKIPVVVYLRYRGDDHFSVLRGIDAKYVALADPSWGNRTFSKADFTAMWHTREGDTLRGKALLVLPQQSDEATQHHGFFGLPHPNSLLLEGLVTQRAR